MIKVTRSPGNGGDAKFPNTKEFVVDETGALIIKSDSYGTPLAAFAAGQWKEVVVTEEPKPHDYLDLDKLDAVLSPGEHLFLTGFEADELCRREKDKIDVYSHNGVTTETWRGHQIHISKPLYEEEIVARSRASVPKP